MTLAPQCVDNTFTMQWAIYQILVHVCCWLVVMPVGWCCWLIPPTIDAEAESPPQTCCCCPVSDESPAPSKDLPQAPPCCCDPVPAAYLTLPDDEVVPTPSLVFTFVVNLDLLFHSVTEHLLTVAIDPSPPPLHVLHCIWLC